MRASNEGHDKCIKLLLEKGATLNFQSTVSLIVNNFCHVQFCEKSSVEVDCVTTAHCRAKFNKWSLLGQMAINI